MSLTEKAGQKNPPTTLMGNLESRVKQLEASGEDLSKMKGQTYDEFMNDITQGQRTMIKLEDEGLVRATAREIIDKDIKSKKIKLPKEIEADFKQGGGEPIDVFRQFYGEDALEQLNSMVPDFRQMYSSKEAAEAAIKKFKFEFKADRPPGSISIEDAKKAEQEFNIIPADSEEGKVITEKLIGKPKASVTELVTAEKIILDMKNMDPMDAMKEANKVLKREGKYKNLQEKDVERIMEDTNDFIFGRDIPEDPEGFATGGRVGMVGGGITKLAKKLIKKTKKYKFTGEESLNDLYELERQGKITREDMNVYSPRYLEYLDAQIINKEKLYTPKEWEKTPEVLKNKMRGRIDPDWEEANFGEDFNWDQARSTEMKQQQQLKDFDITGRTKNSKGGVSQGLDYLMGIERRGYAEGSCKFIISKCTKYFISRRRL
jgi:DNA repair protein RadC